MNNETNEDKTSESQSHLIDDEPKTCETFEDLLEVSGSMGFFQIRLFIILTLMDIATGSCMYYFVFANAIPDFSCSDGYYGNATTEGSCKWQGEKQCTDFNFTGKSSFISEFSLVCSSAKSYIPKLATSIQMAGVLISAIIAGQLADSLGRKKTLLVSATLMLTFHICTGFVNSWQLFIALRFFVGLCVGGTMALDFSIPMEFIGTRYRTLCGSLSIFEFALLLLALFDYLGLNWRYLAFASGGVCVPLLLCILIWVPESVRWLVQKGRYEEAEDIMRKLAARNKRPVGDLAVLKKIAHDHREGKKNAKNYSYWHLFRNRKIAMWTVTLIVTWFSLSCNLYGFSDKLSTLGGSLIVNVVIAASVAMPMGWSVIYLGNKLGRKPVYLIFNTVAVLASVVVIVLGLANLQQEDSLSVAILAILGRSGISVAFIIGYIYTAELYPTLLRNIGLGAASTAARVGGIAAPQVSYLGELYHWTVPYMGFGAVALASTILIAVFVPETAGKPLPENMGEENNLDRRSSSEKESPIPEIKLVKA